MPRDAPRRGAEGSDVGAVERAAEGILAMLERVVSGGQTGADQAGWRAAQACGMKPWNATQVKRVIERDGA